MATFSSTPAVSDTPPELAPVVWRLNGLSCTNCALSVEKHLAKEGLQQVVVDFAAAEARFLAPPGQNLQALQKQLQQMGYGVQTQAPQTPAQAHKHFHFHPLALKLWVSALCTLPLLLAMLLPRQWLHNGWVQLGLALPVYGVGVLHFGRSAWFSLRGGSTNMDVLIFLGSTAAMAYSLYGTIKQLGHNYAFYETAASIITLVLLGNWLEHLALNRTRKALAQLTAAQPAQARILVAEKSQNTYNYQNPQLQVVPARSLQVGQVCWVTNGENLPADGEVLWGNAQVNESLLTGESLPVQHQPGSHITGGSWVIAGTLAVRVTAVGSQSVLGQMTDLVKQAQAQKPKAQLVSDRISAVFVPVVLGLAVLAFVLGYGVLEFGLKASLLNAIAVLVISCPCAMGLAVPTAVVVGLGRAARQGVWVKSAQVLDAIRSLRTVVFDKTGTLTTGRFSFQKMELAPGYTQEIILQHLLALEEHSQHPLAVSIRHIWAQLPKLAQFEYVTETPDFGLEGQTPSGEHWQAGRAPSSHPTAPEAWLSATVWLWHQQTPVAALWLQDEVRPEAAATVRKLQQQGLTVVMLSGDSASRCWPIAQQLGIQTVYAAQNPAQKLEVLSQLKAQGATLMVGDGINDAPALAAATVGVTLGGVTQLTAQAAQVVLVKPDLSKIVWLVKMGRATVGTIHQNLFWAFFYNVLAIPVAGLGYLSPMVGAATMALSDLVVIGNSLRLRWRKL